MNATLFRQHIWRGDIFSGKWLRDLRSSLHPGTNSKLGRKHLVARGKLTVQDQWSPLITRDAIHTASLRYVSNNDKIRSALHMNFRPIAERRLIGYVMLFWKTRSMAVQSNPEVVFSHPETLRPRDLFTLKRVSQPNQPRCRSVRWTVAVYSTWSCRQDVMSGQLGQYPLHFLIGA
jgi:hypothetical protein